MAKGVSIKDTDLGMKELVRTFRGLANEPYVKVGFLEDEGGHRGSNLSVVAIASVHEFGTTDGRVPERSFVRTAYDENLSDFESFAKEQKDDIVFRGKKTDVALGLIGQKIQAAIQRKITEGDSSWDPLAPSTIAAKGSDKPLIDTGQMRASVRYQVVNK